MTHTLAYLQPHDVGYQEWVGKCSDQAMYLIVEDLCNVSTSE